jgi:hypothetical protein
MKFQFELWRLFVSVTSFAIAAGSLRWGLWEVNHFGGGFFPSLLFVVVAFSCMIAIGILFRRATDFALVTLYGVIKYFEWFH